MSLPPLSFDGGSQVLKEIQNAISFACLDDLFQKESMQGSKQQKHVFDLYHGTADKNMVSFVEQALAGHGMFQGLYDTPSTLQVVDRNTDTTRQLVLKPYLHGHPKKTIHVGGNGGITKQLLSSHALADHAQITGRMILDHGKDALKHGKKMLSVVLDKDSPYKDLKFPSGTGMEDYALWCCQQVYMRFGPGSTKKKDDKQDDGPTMPTNYIFKGMIAFFLFGPITSPVMESYKSTLYSCKDDEPGNKAGQNG